MHANDLPYASSAEALTSPELNRARWLIAEELRVRHTGEIARADRESAEKQLAIAEEREVYLDEMAAAFGSGGEDAVVLSPLSGRHRHQNGGATAAPLDRSALSSSVDTHSLLFPQVPVPSCERASSSHRRTRSHSKRPRSGDDEERGDGADAYEASHESAKPPASQDALLFSSQRSTPPPTLSPIASDAVYYETILGQSIGAQLFLAHNTLAVEGEAFLTGMQRLQDRLLVSRHQATCLNALRCCEQREFAKAHHDLTAQTMKARSKVMALEKTLGVKTGPEAASSPATQTRSVLATLDA